MDNSISNAEEAQELVNEECRTFDEISKQEFDDSILFKNTKKMKRKPHKDSETKTKIATNIDREDLSYTR